MIRQVLASSLSDMYAPGKAMGDEANISTLVSPIITNVLVVSGIFAFFTIIFAGFSYITAGGDKAKIEQSQNMLNYAILGIIVVALAFLITRIVGTVFGIKFF